MIKRTVPRRYAQALLMIANERNALDEYEKELKRFAQILQEEPKIKALMDNPKIPPEEKKQVLEKILKGSFNEIIRNFLHLIIDKRRESNYLDIIQEFMNYADEARNILDAEVRSAVQLLDKDFRELEKKLSQASGKTVRLKSIIDPSLIGGIVVRLGDTVIDGSVVKKLALLKKRLGQTSLKELG